jgi:hypothetical protein
LKFSGQGTLHLTIEYIPCCYWFQKLRTYSRVASNMSHVHTYRVSYAKLTTFRRMLARQFLARNIPLTCVWSLDITTSWMFKITNYRLRFSYTMGT